MMSNPKYTVILTGLFCSVVAGGTSHFYSFFRKYFGKGRFFGMKTLAFGLASQAQAKNGHDWSPASSEWKARELSPVQSDKPW